MIDDPPLKNRNRWIDAGYWLTWLALVIALLYVALAYSPGRPADALLYNSDAMYFPVVFHDIVTSGRLTGWDLPTNPYFFPDMALFVPILAVVSEIHAAVVLYGILQLLLIAAGMILLYRHFSAQNRVGQSLALLTLAFCLVRIAAANQSYYIYTLMSVHHSGVLAVIPFATWALLCVIEPGRSVRERKRAAWILFGLIFLTSLSDSLFVIQFVLPVVIALLLWGKSVGLSWRRLLVLAVAILLVAAAGQWLRHFIIPVGKLLLYLHGGNPDVAADSISNLTAWIRQMPSRDPWLVSFWLLSVAALVALILVVAGYGDAKERPFALVATFALCSAIFSVIAILTTANFQDEFSVRYILPVLYLPLFLGLPLLSILWLQCSQQQSHAASVRERRLGLGSALLALFFAGFILMSAYPIALAAQRAEPDPFMACLTHETTERKLHYGLAEYWQANYASALSEGKLRIVSITPAFAPDLWNGNPATYQYPFEFVISNSSAPPAWQIDKESLWQKFGPPAASFMCKGSRIYVYDQSTNTLLHNWFGHHPDLIDLAEIGDVAELYGYALPSPIGGVSAGLSIGANEKWDQNEGTLAYARLQHLPAGSYAVALDLYADSENSGVWQLYRVAPDGTLEDQQLLESVPITRSGKQVLTGHFELKEEAGIRVGVEYNGHGALYIDRIRIAHVEPAQSSTYQFTEQSAPTDDAAQGQLKLIYPFADSAIQSGDVDFVWQWRGQPLPKGQTFEVRLWPNGTRIHYGAHDALAGHGLIRQIGDTYTLHLNLDGAYSVMQYGAGDYQWTVAIVAIEPAYQDLQIEAPAYPLIVQP